MREGSAGFVEAQKGNDKPGCESVNKRSNKENKGCTTWRLWKGEEIIVHFLGSHGEHFLCVNGFVEE